MTPSRTLRMAYLVSQYPAVTHTFILREIRRLRELGFDVTVVSVRAPDRPWEKLSAVEQEEAKQTFGVLNAGFGRIAAAHIRTLLRRPLSYLGGLGYAIRLAGADLRAAVSNLFYFAEAVVAGDHIVRCGIAHVHTHFSSTVALFLARVFPVTFSATIHGPDEFTSPASFYLAEKAARARFLCVISNFAASQLMRASDPQYWSKVDVARLGVDSSVFTPRPHRENPRRFELLCVGRLAPVKAQALLIRAVGKLAREGRTEIHLRLVGDGPSRPYLERLVSELNLQEYVTLEGACNQDRVQAFYRETDLFVLASFAEGVPVVLMEAMAMEIPCLATWINGVPELISHGVDGWLVAPGSEAELTAAISRLADDPELRRRLGKAGRVRVQAQYELDSNVRLLAAIYQRRLSMNEA